MFLTFLFSTVVADDAVSADLTMDGPEGRDPKRKTIFFLFKRFYKPSKINSDPDYKIYVIILFFTVSIFQVVKFTVSIMLSIF